VRARAGYQMGPTVILGALRAGSGMMREEIFGPIVGVTYDRSTRRSYVAGQRGRLVALFACQLNAACCRAGPGTDDWAAPLKVTCFHTCPIRKAAFGMHAPRSAESAMIMRSCEEGFRRFSAWSVFQGWAIAKPLTRCGADLGRSRHDRQLLSLGDRRLSPSSDGAVSRSGDINECNVRYRSTRCLGSRIDLISRGFS
jgi:hypothetical protein